METNEDSTNPDALLFYLGLVDMVFRLRLVNCCGIIVLSAEHNQRFITIPNSNSVDDTGSLCLNPRTH